MADHGWDDVPHGHFGSATYDSEEHAWRFRINLDEHHVLKPIGESATVAHPDPTPAARSDRFTTNETTGLCHTRQIKSVVRHDPDLQSAAQLLRPFLQASEAVENAVSRHDPVKGELLAFGKINDQAARRPSRLVAFPSGPSGCDVRIVQVQLQKQGWDDSKDAWLEVPVLAGEETVSNTGSSPIQQIAFAQPVEGGETLLAVRFLATTMILRPVLKHHGPARLETRVLQVFSSDQTGGDPYADVSFNPWFTRQFAIIDQSARWSIWEVESSRSAAAKFIHGSNPREKTKGPSRNPNDGWARIMWLGGPNTVLVANRRNISLFKLSDGPDEREDVDVGLSAGRGWILDIAVVARSLDLVCVLTSSHMLFFAVNNSDDHLRAHLKARLRHYRSPEDLTLKLNVYRDELYSIVTLRSALVPSITAYRLTWSEAGSLAFQEPFQLDVGHEGPDQRAGTLPCDLNLQSVEYVDQMARYLGDSASVNRESSQFISATILMNDMSVLQRLYVSAPSVVRHGLKAPSWKGKLPFTASRWRSDVLDLEDDAALLGNPSIAAPVPTFRKQLRANLQDKSSRDWTVDYTLSVSQLDTRDNGVSNIVHMLTQVRRRLENFSEQMFPPLQTLREMAQGELAIDNIDEASEHVASLGTMEPVRPPAVVENSDADTATSTPLIRSVEAVGMSGGETSHQHDLAMTYDGIVAQWISTLPNNVAARTRLAKEQLARCMAAEVTLASYSVRYKDADQEENQQDTPNRQSQTWKLPVRGLETSRPSQSSYVTASQSRLQSQNVLPTPSPTATPSVTTASSRTSFIAAEVSRLSKYTTFSKPASSALPRSLNRILSHWEPGTDPESYDWHNTSRQITQQLETEELDSYLTERERERLQRKAERHIRRQRKEAAASQQQHMASSQMPELVVSASQPGPVKVESQSGGWPGSSTGGVAGASQSQMSGPASQAVAGRFGGRPPVKKRRKQGF